MPASFLLSQQPPTSWEDLHAEASKNFYAYVKETGYQNRLSIDPPTTELGQAYEEDFVRTYSGTSEYEAIMSTRCMAIGASFANSFASTPLRTEGIGFWSDLRNAESAGNALLNATVCVQDFCLNMNARAQTIDQADMRHFERKAAANLRGIYADLRELKAAFPWTQSHQALNFLVLGSPVLDTLRGPALKRLNRVFGSHSSYFEPAVLTSDRPKGYPDLRQFSSPPRPVLH